MPSEFVKEQLEKLLDGRVLLIVSEGDFEELVLAAVPALRLEADEQEERGQFVKAQALQRLARELSTAPIIEQPRVVNLSTSVH